MALFGRLPSAVVRSVICRKLRSAQCVVALAHHEMPGNAVQLNLLSRSPASNRWTTNQLTSPAFVKSVPSHFRKFLYTIPPVISSPFSPNGLDRLVILQISSLYTPYHSLQAVSQVKSLSTGFIDWRKINFVSIWRCSEDERGCGQWIAGSEDGYIMRLT